MSTKWTINGQQVFFHHTREYVGEELSPKGGCTVAYMEDEDGDTLEIAQALCNPRDHFNKAIGRAVSFGRLKKLVEGLL